MARSRGKQKDGREPGADAPEGSAAGRQGLPEMARRALAFGLSGFFLTEETIRKALGDTLPKDWMDFALAQSERTRKEFLERLSFEIAQTLEKVDVAGVMDELLAGRTVEVRAEIRLGAREKRGGATRFQVSIEDDGAEA